MADRIHRLLLAAAGLAAAVAVAPANAQSMGDMISKPGTAIPGPKRGAGQAPEKQPDSLPGARPQSDRVTPSARSSAEMSPNDALFDAINRGDIADARDAVTRGAELNATNILGLTPIDLSVDLSRNDITMFLLSLRGADKSSRMVATSAPNKPGKSVRAVASRPAPAPRFAAAAKPVPVDPPVRRQMVSADPGTPAPQVGFLGFGGAPRP